MTPTCSQGNQALFLCQSKECYRSNPFICNSVGCQCRGSEHSECDFITWKKFKARITSLQSDQSQTQNIVFILEDYIKDAQRFSQSLKNQVAQYQKFISRFQDNRSQLLQLVWEEDFTRFTKKRVLDDLQFEQIVTNHSTLKGIIKKNVNTIKQNQKEIAKDFTSIYCLGSNSVDSSILDSIDDVKGFFKQPIHSLKLVYRASDNGFQTDRFHQMCDGLSNTVVLVKTEFGNVIGGFTPVAWGGLGALSDDTSNSFMFSVTNKERMPVVNTKYAIFNCSKTGPIFGGGNSLLADLQICNKAHQIPKSASNFPVNYNHNGKAVSGSGAVHSLTGQAKGRYFLVAEWEVFKITFSQQISHSVQGFLA